MRRHSNIAFEHYRLFAFAGLIAAACVPGGDGPPRNECYERLCPLPATCDAPWSCLGSVHLADSAGNSATAGFSAFCATCVCDPPPADCGDTLVLLDLGECVVRVSDNCTIYTEDCTLNREPLNVGAVSIVGSSVLSPTILTLGPSGYTSDSVIGFTTLWSGGDILRVSVEGDALFGPASAEIVAPTPAVLASPIIVDGVIAPIDRASDLLLEWPIPSYEGAGLSLALTTGPLDPILACDVTDDGRLTVPSEALSYLTAGPAQLLFTRGEFVITTSALGRSFSFSVNTQVGAQTTLE